MLPSGPSGPSPRLPFSLPLSLPLSRPLPNPKRFPCILGVTSWEGLEDLQNLEKLRHPSSRPGGSWEQVVQLNLAMAMAGHGVF